MNMSPRGQIMGGALATMDGLRAAVRANTRSPLT